MDFRVGNIHDYVRPPDAGEAAAGRDAVAALARPRLVGSAGAAQAAAELRRRFEELGYEVRELPFSFSTWPGRFGVPAAGALHAAAGAAAGGLLLAGVPGAALVVLLTEAALLAAMGLLARPAILRLPWGRAETANWLVSRPGVRPRYLVMAHRDSKSQRVSLFLRVAGVGTTIFTWVVLTLLAILALVDPAWQWGGVTAGASVLAILAGVVLVQCRAENASPGALDNASGLAALLGLAEREREEDDVAFLVTDGEELGLAGALAACGQLPPLFGAINLDGLDDEGDFAVVERHGWPRRGLAPHLCAALLAAAEGLDVRARRRDLPAGLLVDHIPLMEAGIPAVTVMRGTVRSLRRVHRPDDHADRLTGAGVAATVALVAGALRLLRGAPSLDSEGRSAVP